MSAQNQNKSGVPADKLALFDKLIATNPKIERKGANNAYAALNGNMFLFMGPAGKLSIRLPDGVREGFLRKYETRLFESYGVVQKEYVAVPDDLLKNTKELAQYLAASYEYVKSLKPKPSTKKG